MKLDDFLEQVPFQFPNNRKLWEQISYLKDSFDSPIATEGTVSKSLSTNYLPIEFLRGEKSLKQFNKEKHEIHREFLSSGTTASTRSLSYFSRDGLLFFKAQSLKIFFDVIKRFFPGSEFTIPGISMIPTVAEWPKSSLAQMIGWFGEFWDLDYATAEDLATKIQSLDPKKPIWFFATPFQLINLFDDGFAQALPKGSIVFETGGTKGKSREITKKELHSLIVERFDIPQSSILSEYSMCELASQAYEFVNHEREERYFRFPSWAQISVSTGYKTFSKKGIGALIIDDPLRIDYPYPLRTQDLAEIYDNGFFKILGRLPKAPLKGCSLLTEELISKKTSPQTIQSKPYLSQKLKSEAPEIDWEAILKALIDELGSKNAAREAILDLQSAMPKSFEQFNKMITNSKAKRGDHWFFILPNNHSLAGFYPLYVAKAAGLKASVRLPEAFAHEHSSLQIFLRTLGHPNLFVVSHKFRIQAESFPQEIDHVAIFGEDSTVQNVKELCPVPVKGFGSGITISAIRDLSKDNATLLAKDILSLGQRGCMSTRALMANGSWDDLLLFVKHLQKACRKFWSEDLTLLERLGIEQEIHRYKEHSSLQTYEDLNDIFFPILNQKADHLEPSQFLSPHPFVLPIFFYGNDHEQLIQDTNQFPSLVSVSSCGFFKDKIKKIVSVPLGQANRAVWDGSHFRSPLFEVEALKT